LAALEEGLPPCAGMALGVDRLVMLLAGATSMADVLAFSWDER
jgi:lysyl-tRNA synthetase class 2